MSTKVTHALAELRFDAEGSAVLDAGNLFSVRDLLAAGYTKLEMQRRDAEAARVAALEEKYRRDPEDKKRSDEGAL